MTSPSELPPDATAEPGGESETRRSADSSERAYHTIRKLLVEFRLKPEERINEVQLSRSLGLSRTPVREALNRLASEGFVTLTTPPVAAPTHGTHVVMPASEDSAEPEGRRCPAVDRI